MDIGIIVVAVIAGAFAGMKIKKEKQAKKANSEKKETQE